MKRRKIEVVRLERLVYDHCDDGEGGPMHFHVTVSFNEQDGIEEVNQTMAWFEAYLAVI